MGSFGTEFVNVVDPGEDRRVVRGDGVAPINDDIDALMGQLFRDRGSSWPRGATLYFPPGTYRVAERRLGVAPQPLVADLRFPREFTLRFAEGARLVLDDEVLVDIQGEVEAPLSQIFELATGARVMLGATATLRVFPEWWGARSGDLGFDSSSALQACLDAAVLRFPTVGGSRLPAITVILGGPYRVSTELVLGREETIHRRRFPPPAPSVELIARQVFRGAGPDRATFVALRGTARFPAMLRFGFDATTSDLSGHVPSGVLVRGVSFQANGVADTCLWLPTGGSLDDRFEDCAFRGARTRLVLAGRMLEFDGPLSRTVGSIDLSRLKFIDCAFDTRLPVPTPERVPTGLYFRADQTLPLNPLRNPWTA